MAMTDKIIHSEDNVRHGQFMVTREDYIEKLNRLVKMVNEKYPEIADEAFDLDIEYLNKYASLHELVDSYDCLYQKIKELNTPSYRPEWMFRTKFYS